MRLVIECFSSFFVKHSKKTRKEMKMKIKMIKCPCCGAQLDVDEKTKRSRCKYCRTQFFIEGDEIEVYQNVSTGYAVARSESVTIGYSSGYAGHYASSDDRAEHESTNFSDGCKVEKVSAKELEKFNGWTSSVDSGWGWYLEIVKTILSIVLPALLLCVLINIFFPSEKDSQADTENVIQETDAFETNMSAQNDVSTVHEKGVDLAGCDMYELEDFLSNGKHAEEKIVGNRD